MGKLITDNDRLIEKWKTIKKMSNKEKFPPYLLECQKRCCIDMRRELRIKGDKDGTPKEPKDIN